MKIAFDASDLCTGRADGTTRYMRELALRLPILGKNDTWDFYGPCDNPTTIHPTQPPLEKGRGRRSLPLFKGELEGVHVQWNSVPFPFAWTQTRFMFELLKKKPDVLFMPIQQLPIFRPRKMKTVAVIHDLAFHEYPQQFRYKDWLLLHTFSAQVANEADAIIAVSEATKKDIKKYYGREKNVYVVHHGIDHERFKKFSDSEKQEGLEKLQKKYPELKKPYILFVGQIQPRKNIVRLVEAFEVLRSHPLQLPLGQGERLQLVIAGGHGWNNAEIYKRIETSSAKENILVTGAVPDELLPALYANAEVFVLPSLQEGFGIPLIEAAACGVPLVTSDRSSMKEIVECNPAFAKATAGETSILIDPENISSMVSGINYALMHKVDLSRKSLELAKQFSWDKTATETLRILKGVV